MSIELISKLREMTGAGIKDCNNALKEANNDIEQAIKILREKGIASAVKRADRSAKQGIVYSSISDDKKTGVLVEVNCETDFVARTDQFKNLVVTIASHVAKSQSQENILEQKYDNTQTVKDLITNAIATIGENIILKRAVKFVSNGVVSSYIHMNNSLGVLVDFECSEEVAKSEQFQTLTKEIAMQIAAVSPLYITRDQVPAEEVAKEKEIYVKQLQDEGKPANIIEKIVVGKLDKFYSQICLIDQPYMRDTTGKEKIKEVIAKAGKDIVVKQFARFKIGE
ncbi:MAG: translation elongation factor Ts [Endomicrobiia bacterium]|nr:translation elongation factor Ts [Endomicrobiaceae bacterium]MDD3052866.1 translation elongation factor Ts [Endomicrobiaceae bacterium]MDD3922088.1 translation elongation factor Ts [Endomicrobiaceae bacterium]MDD5101950.1 translation elongation factor Ts [Endomicrobiaceae bacterium]